MGKVSLVTGANGFIGSNLVRCLVERGHRVKAMVLAGTSTQFLKGVDCEIVNGDITKPQTLDAPMKGVDIVFHLAALASDWGPMELFKVLNYDGAMNVLEAARKAGVGRVMHTSSLGVHEYRPTFGADEKAPLDSTLNPYCITKRMADEGARRFGVEHNFPVTIVRPGLMPFGPRDTTSFAPLAKALEKGIFQYVNGGTARICTAYVENLVEGMAMAAESPAGAGETFIICDDEPRSWREIIETFCDGLGVKKPRFSIPAGPLHPIASAMMGLWNNLPLPGSPPLTHYRIRVASQDLYFKNDKAKRVLGWKPKVEFTEGVRRMCEWYFAWRLR